MCGATNPISPSQRKSVFPSALESYTCLVISCHIDLIPSGATATAFMNLMLDQSRLGDVAFYAELLF